MSHSRIFPRPQQAKPKLAIPSTTTMKRPIEARSAGAEVINKASSLALPTTTKRRRKSVSDSVGSASEVTAKRRRTGKDPKQPGQSPEKSGEEQEGSTRESYPDPRWMNEPRKYLGLRDHRYKYISKITNKLLENDDWNKPAREYQEIQQKKTGTWASLNQHLYPNHKDCIPPSVNPLELILDLILKHGAATPEDQNQEPSISGCFSRLVSNLVGNESLAKLIDQDLVDTLASRERTGLDEVAAQQASPVVSAVVASLDEVKSPHTLGPTSPAVTAGLDVKHGPEQSPPTSPKVIRTLSQDKRVLASPSTSHHGTGTGSAKYFGPPHSTSNYSGPIAQPLYGPLSGFHGPISPYGPSGLLGSNNQGFVDVSNSPVLPVSPHNTGVQFFSPQRQPSSRTHSSLGYPSNKQQMVAAVAHSAIPTQSYIPQPWTLQPQQSSFASQDPGSTAADADQLFPFGISSQEPPSSEYHTPKEHTTSYSGLYMPPQGLDVSSLNNLIMDETEFWAYLNTSS
ncbi:hypothetical protein ABW20_dc0108268 [Dactylellina cionopaga]|nr:hypothetical protein ABW20_dc0108268 [Dactylellina cionopaga]